MAKAPVPHRLLPVPTQPCPGVPQLWAPGGRLCLLPQGVPPGHCHGAISLLPVPGGPTGASIPRHRPGSWETNRLGKAARPSSSRLAKGSTLPPAPEWGPLSGLPHTHSHDDPEGRRWRSGSVTAPRGAARLPRGADAGAQRPQESVGITQLAGGRAGIGSQRLLTVTLCRASCTPEAPRG